MPMPSTITKYTAMIAMSEALREIRRLGFASQAASMSEFAGGIGTVQSSRQGGKRGAAARNL